MATYSDIAVAATSSDLRRRVEYALTIAAVNVYAEGTTVPAHTARAAYATKVLNGQYDLHGAVLGILTNPTIAAAASSATADNSVSDGNMQFAINSIFSALAGA